MEPATKVGILHSLSQQYTRSELPAVRLARKNRVQRVFIRFPFELLGHTSRQHPPNRLSVHAESVCDGGDANGVAACSAMMAT